MTLKEIMEAVTRAGGLPPIVYGPTPNNSQGDYQLAPERITLRSYAEGPEVLRHELAHALQNRTIGMTPSNPVDQAIRSRIGAPQYDPELSRTLAENLAEYVGNRNLLNVDPLTSMSMRALANQMFNKLYRGGY